MKKIFMLIALMTSLNVFAARVEDIEILEVGAGNEAEFHFKVRSRLTPAHYFYLAFEKIDKKALEKMNFVHVKMSNPSQYRLDLEILSFSGNPSGAFYRSADTEFFMNAVRNPNQTKKPNKQ